MGRKSGRREVGLLVDGLNEPLEAAEESLGADER